VSERAVRVDRGTQILAWHIPRKDRVTILREGFLEQVSDVVAVGSGVVQRVGKQGSSQCILVVEDDASLANLEAGILAAHGYAVAMAHSGEMAIAALQQALPDLVLLDLDLSGPINGWDVLQMLRSYSATPVLLTSSESAVNRQIRIRGETRSTLDHLPKPYLMQTLLKRIERMLAIGPY